MDVQKSRDFPSELKFSLSVMIKQWRLLRGQLKEIETEMMAFVLDFSHSGSRTVVKN